MWAVSLEREGCSWVSEIQVTRTELGSKSHAQSLGSVCVSSSFPTSDFKTSGLWGVGAMGDPDGALDRQPGSAQTFT